MHTGLETTTSCLSLLHALCSNCFFILSVFDNSASKLVNVAHLWYTYLH